MASENTGYPSLIFPINLDFFSCVGLFYGFGDLGVTRVVPFLCCSVSVYQCICYVLSSILRRRYVFVMLVFVCLAVLLICVFELQGN